MATTKEQTLFVGDSRICPQVAYVLDVENYEMVERLTEQNIEQYRNYSIYVCVHERQSGKYVKLHIKITKQLNIQYLDDICRCIDEEYDANHERHKDDFRNFVAGQIKPAIQQNKIQEQSVKDIPALKQPMWQRICCSVKHPLRAIWHVLLRIKDHDRKLKKKKHNYVQIYRGNLKFLKSLRPSELFLYVLKAKPKPHMFCTQLETNIRVGMKGFIQGCNSAVVPFGNLLRDGELNEIYHSAYARIIKLSSLNRSYCLCDLNSYCKGYCAANDTIPVKSQWQTVQIPTSIVLSFDQSCNLCCKSCRNQSYKMDDTAKYISNMMTTKLLQSGWLDQVQRFTMAGMGEVFYSPYYRRLLITDVHRQQIEILSNGTLFNQANWQLVSNKYQTISVNISVDAATAETYQRLRGADFNCLMQNLTMLGELRRQGKILKFTLYFIIQRDNFREMPDFVQLGKRLGVDKINFQRLNNWGVFTPAEFLEKCLIINNQYLDYELWCILQDSIFQDPIVNLQGLQRYIDNSEKRYRKRYEREQRTARERAGARSA